MTTKIESIIIDDQIKNVKILSFFLNKNCPEIEIVGEAYTIETALNLINSKRPLIIFLDIELNEGTAFDLLDRISYKNSKIVFTTAHNKYAVQAFKHNTVDYLLKPIKEEELINTVERIKKEIQVNNYKTLSEQIESLKKHVSLLQTQTQTQTQGKLTISSIKTIDIIDIENIVYVKSEGKYSVFILEDKEEIVSSKNLGAYQDYLIERGFWRIHNSYLINLSKVEKVIKDDSNYCLMKNRKKIPISSRKYRSFIKKLE